MTFQANVVLTATTPGIYPKQRLLELNAERSSIPIGRASKSPNKGLTGKVDNAWFDSPVMSREHAELFFDGDNESILLKDIKSMHGTRLNGSEIPVMVPHVLKDGDKIVFGAEVRRGFEIFPACEFIVSYNIVSWRSNSAAFEVPYSSDIEEEQISDHEYYEDDERISTTSHREDETPVESPVQKISVAITSVDVTAADLRADDSSPGLDDENGGEESSELLRGLATSSDGRGGDRDDSDICDSEQESDQSEDSLDMGEENVDRGQTQYDEEILDTDYGEDDEFDAEIAVLVDGYSVPQEQDQAPGSSVELHTSALLLGMMAEDEKTGVRDNADAELKDSETRKSTLCALHHAESEAGDGSFGFSAFNDFTAGSTKLPVELSSRWHDEDVLFDDDLDLETNYGYARTPSPSDAAMVKKTNSVPVHHLPHQQWQQLTSAQILGEKSGKHDYFAAREDNKATAGSMQSARADGNEWLSLWSRSGQQLLPRTTNDAQTNLSADRLENASPTKLDVLEESNGQCLRHRKAIAVDDACSVNESEPAVSVVLHKEQSQGTSLLNRTSATEATASEANRAVSQELDMTSAASFAQSKALIEQNINEDRRGTRSGVSIDDLMEHPIVRDEGIQRKRKAAEISKDQLNESTELDGDIPMGLQATEPSAISSTSSAVPTEGLEQRPAKKFGRFAEAVGYAALGGVAVGAGLFSLLVATAPDFV